MKHQLKFTHLDSQDVEGRIIVVATDPDLKYTTVSMEAWYEVKPEGVNVITGYGGPRNYALVPTEQEAVARIVRHHGRAIKRARPMEPDAHLKVYGVPRGTEVGA